MNNGQIRITAQLDDSTLPNPVPMSICDSPAAILLVITLNQCISIPRLDEDKERALVHRPGPRASCLVQRGREALWKVPCHTVHPRATVPVHESGAGANQRRSCVVRLV